MNADTASWYSLIIWLWFSAVVMLAAVRSASFVAESFPGVQEMIARNENITNRNLKSFSFNIVPLDGSEQ